MGFNVSTVTSEKFNSTLKYLDFYISNVINSENIERIQSSKFKKKIIQDNILYYVGNFSFKTIEGQWLFV